MIDLHIYEYEYDITYIPFVTEGNWHEHARKWSIIYSSLNKQLMRLLKFQHELPLSHSSFSSSNKPDLILFSYLSLRVCLQSHQLIGIGVIR